MVTLPVWALVAIALVFILFACKYTKHIKQQAEQSCNNERTALRNRVDEYSKLCESVQNEKRVLSKEREQIAQEKDVLAHKQVDLRDRQKYLDDEISKAALIRYRDYVDNVLKTTSHNPHFSNTLVLRHLESAPTDALLDRFRSAQTKDFVFTEPLNVRAKMLGSRNEEYHVTLNSCSCFDFVTRKTPCKHMLKLAMELGVLTTADTSETRHALAELRDIRLSIEKESKHLKRQQEQMTKLSDSLKHLQDEQQQAMPWLAKYYAEAVEAVDLHIENALRTKSPPAPKAADEVAEIRRAKKKLQIENKLLSHQLLFYESLFPWLEEFKELSIADAVESQAVVFASEDSRSEYDTLRHWLSTEEYSKLSTAEKYQLALDRYCSRANKTNWDIGIEYERYIGYLCESNGYHVHYTGANLGLEDMGRDLILAKGNERIIVQCKRWAQEKTIHEKHIFQLFGSCVLYELNNPKCTIKGVFVTSTKLSEVASNCAQRLGIEVYESIPFTSFPLIKCNISRSGEKIYHLPFDQQYDRVVIERKKGEFFASTVAEAEASGFRRAKVHLLSP